MPDRMRLLQHPAAIDDANAVATIKIEQGGYTEQIAIARAVTLTGDRTDLRVIDGGGSGPVVTVASGARWRSAGSRSPAGTEPGRAAVSSTRGR
jgi:hypothetical protein